MNIKKDGVLVLDKPLGISSNQTISRLKKILNIRKIGFIGTLDPLATGALPVFTGKCTKLIPYFEERNKTYRATITLGLMSDSLDEGTPIERVPLPEMKNEEICDVINNFVGKQEQRPPIYSAIKIDGIRSYKLARSGSDFKVKTRNVEFFNFNDIQINFPKVSFTVEVSKGTYIRSLALDIGQKLKTKAIVSELCRLSHGDEFSLKKAKSLDEIKNLELDDNSDLFLKNEELIITNFTSFRINEDTNIWRLKQGQRIKISLNDIHFSLTEDHSTDISKKVCFAFDHSNGLMAAGSLEFSRDSVLYFYPHKLLI